MADGVVAALKHGDTGPVIVLEDSPVAEATKTPPHDCSRYRPRYGRAVRSRRNRNPPLCASGIPEVNSRGIPEVNSRDANGGAEYLKNNETLPGQGSESVSTCRNTSL